MTQAPPRPRFEVPRAAEPQAGLSSALLSAKGPKIVVPVTHSRMPAPATTRQQTASQIIAAFPNQTTRTSLPRPTDVNARLAPTGSQVASKGKRFLVAAGLVLAFSGMLLATHRYVTSHWNPLVGIPSLSGTFIVGREGVTITDLNLRPDPSPENEPIGLAENGSRVRVLTVNSNWYEVQVLQHARPKADQYTSDRGWVNKKYLKFD